MDCKTSLQFELVLIDLAVFEKMVFEYYGYIHVYSPGAGQRSRKSPGVKMYS